MQVMRKWLFYAAWGPLLRFVANVAAAASVLRFVAGCALSGLYIVRGCRVGFWCLVESIAPRRGYPNYRIFVFRESLWTVLPLQFRL